ncbi:DUF4357 domain-containing protein [Endozoicomonas sp.]|nr:DUF4357 domain-containing protein [Endozoicomonas sp.]
MDAKDNEKDYWIHTSAFVSKDDNLTKTHIRYLEGKLIQAAYNSKRIIVMNSASSGASLPEADRAEMDVYMERMLQLLPVLGIHHFSLHSTVRPQQSTLDEQTEKPATPLYLKTKGILATGVQSEMGFTVFKNSEAVKTLAKSCPKGTLKVREALIEKGILTLNKDKYRFTENYEFSSPSAAGDFVSGRSTNGLIAWVTRDRRTLKELEHLKESQQKESEH